jgi:hypothetical protein
MGLRHVSGNKKWDRYNQAKLIAELKERDYSIEDIASRLGIQSKAFIQQQLDGYSAISDYLDHRELYDIDTSFNPTRNSVILVEALLQKNVRGYLGWDEKKKVFSNKKNVERFYKWISPQENLEFDEDEETGDFEILPPIIINHKQIRQISEIVDDPESLDKLEEARDVEEALSQNSGFTQRKFPSELKKAEKILSKISSLVQL